MGLTAYQLLRRGGRFLGAARSWIQWHKRNGSDVTWGSHDVLQPPMTVREVEELAAEVASSHEDERFSEYIRVLLLAQKALVEVKELIPPGNAWNTMVAIRAIKEALGEDVFTASMQQGVEN